MNPRSTGVLLLVAGALGAFVYFYEIRGDEARREAEVAENRLFPGVEAADIATVVMFTNSGEEVRVERREGRWELVEPLVFPGDAFALDGLASALADLSSEAVYENPQPDEEYGLDAAEREVRFYAGQREFVLRVGRRTPVGSNTYVRTGGDDRVYTVTTASVNPLRKTLDDLREKRVLVFDRGAVDRIELDWPGGGVLLEKGADGWRLARPREGAADEDTVDELLSELSFLRATGFEDEPPGDAEAGLESPFLVVKLGGAAPDEDGEAFALEVTIGAPLAGGGEEASHLVRGASPSLYRVASNRVTGIPRDPGAYRFRQLARFPQVEAQRIEMTFERTVSTDEGDDPVEIVATRGDPTWTSEPESMKPEVFSPLVSKLARLRAERILADSMGEAERRELGLAPPRARFRVYGAAANEGDGEAPRFADVKIGVLRPSGIVAQAADSDVVYELDLSLSEQIPVSLEAFRNRFVAVEEPEEPLPPALPLEEDIPTPADESP